VNEIINKTISHIEIHQCLFGYQDGHRLLASSIPFPEEVSSLLLWLSDLAPGLNNLSIQEGYWTGMPLSHIKYYALMRTWLAPEMPRPGCVWTHVLLISFTDIARFSDLSVLIAHVKCPVNTAIDLGMYSKPIVLIPPPIDSNLSQEIATLDVANASRVLQAIYSDHGQGKVIAPSGVLDNTIFAVWSQQHPQLRRSFSFRTASNSSDTLSNSKQFDLIVLLCSDRMQNDQFDYNALEEWEKACINDILFPRRTELRRFLWRYGSDVRLGRKRFKFLVNLYLSTRLERLDGENLYKILISLITALPSPEDAKVLKEDLVHSNQYSLLPLTDTIDMLAFYVSDPMASKLPALSLDAFEEIYHNCSDLSEQIFSIAETAAESVTEVGTNLLNRLATITDAETFLSSTVTKPNLRNKLLILNPSLLDSDNLVNLSGEELLKLFNYVPDNAYELIERILPRLLRVDDINLAEEIVRRFPNLIIETILASLNEGESPIPQSWLKAIGMQSSLILHGGFIERVKTTSALSLLASILGYARPLTLEAGAMIWAKALKNVSDDLDGFDRQKFLVFLLELALYKPVSGCEPLFEIAFDQIHADLRYSRLNWEQRSQLLQYLPNLRWINNWDNCLRLKTGVVNAYVKHGLNPISFKRLTTSPELYKDLIELADDSKAGHQFLKKLI